MTLKDAYDTQEIARFFDMTSRAALARAKRESWQSRPRSGRGGGSEWLVASMPEEMRLALESAMQRQLLDAARAERDIEEAALPEVVTGRLPALRDVTGLLPARNDATQTPAILDDKRRYRALAKADLVRLYIDWQRKHGATVWQKEVFVNAYLGGTWPKLLNEFGERVSWKSLERWKNDQSREGSVMALADRRGLAHKGKSLITNEHIAIILGRLLNPNAPQIGQCVRKIQARCKAEGLVVPSEATIRRWAKVYMQECFDAWTKWREGKKAWNDKCAISILRDWSLVEVGDVVFADGHTLNFETLNPETGKPTRMTLLLFFDGASSHPLGWEVMPSENTACISSAFRRTCIVLGKFPRVVYIDNGKAFRAEFFKGSKDFEQDGFLGLYKDLGCEVIHAWPYHGQSKPIERFFGTMLDMEIFVPSYTGNSIENKPARMMRGEDLHRKLYAQLGGRPLTLEETHTEIARWFCEYVNRPQADTHLAGRTPAEVFQEGCGGGLSDADADRLTLFMLQKRISTITKDGIRLHGRLYWHEALVSRRHEVLVRYDLQFWQTVLVYTLDATPICEARERGYFHIAAGIHPVARVLGTEEQQRDLSDSIALKRGLEKTASADMNIMLETIVLPETREHLTLIQSETQAVSPKPTPAPKVKPMSRADTDAIEAAKVKARAAREAADATTYTPAALMRFADSHAKYDYLFHQRYEHGVELVAEDAAWMEQHESTPDFQRNMKRRYDALLELYRFKSKRAAC